jgi:hypothetical protein
MCGDVDRTPAPTPVQDLECQYFSRGEGKVQLCPKKKAAGWVEADGQTVYQLQADFKNIGRGGGSLAATRALLGYLGISVGPLTARPAQRGYTGTSH